MMSVTSSMTPLIEENSWSTLSTLILVIANHSKEDNNILLKALPIVIPNPGSRGRNSNKPLASVESIMITLSGFWNAKIAI